MARIQLVIDVDTPDELLAALAELSLVTRLGPTMTTSVLNETQGNETAATDPQPARRGRKSAQPAAAGNTTSGSVTPASGGSPAAPSGPDPFGQQIKQAAAEVAAEDAELAAMMGEEPETPAVTLTIADVRSTLFAYTQQHSMKDAQTLMMEHFKDHTGQPVKTITQLQAGDYARFVETFKV